MSLLDDPAYVAALRTEATNVSLGDEYDVAETTIRRHRKKLGIATPIPVKPLDSTGGESEAHNADGSASYVRFSETAWGYDDYCAFIRSKGQDPDEVTFTWGWTSNPAGGFWNKLNNVRSKVAVAGGRMVSTSDVLDAIKSFTYIPEPVAYADESFVIVPTDFQFGKVDWNGGSKETHEQILNSFGKAQDFIREFRPREVCIVDAGDIIENIYSTSSQLATNDLSLPDQVVEAAYAMQRGLQMLAPHTNSLRYAAVSSNHGAHRLGPKSPAGDVHADYGLAVAKMLRNALTLNPEAFGHVTIQVPEPYMESLYFQTSGTDIGVVHGHQAGSPDRIGDWWKGQSHGRMPVSEARILIAGHFHSLRVQQSGDARWIMVGPASDRGSSWFTNAKGEQSESGMLSFTTANNEWNNLKVL